MNNKLSNVKERILYLAENKGIAKKKFIESIGMSYGSFNGTQRLRPLNSDAINNLLSIYPEINANWVLTGQGEIYKKLTKNEATHVITNYMEVPFVPIKAQAGFPTAFGDELYMSELDTVLWEIDDKEYKGNYLVFEVNGDSMDDGSYSSILHGDRILCREVGRHLWNYKLHIHKWNFVLSHPSDGLVVKRLTEHNPETGIINCHSLNPYYDDFEIDINELSAIFNVVDLKRTVRL